ncbi:DNA-methyltransferase [Halobium salinum]|uniref:Type II methyltransferase n=1 Tax=Halobium salinum TaxID=1364940 RepID=A0ABD5PGW2_9EURY|nr:site-specific DNA-methyltransferase [Halobium salinum]
MRTEHRLYVADAADMAAVDDGAVDLVVTSPPYPMIEMWDDLFAEQEPAVRDALDRGDGETAFERMHETLDAVWDEVVRVLAPGGIACVNVGDATRSLDDGFRQYPNHARVLAALRERGLRALPDILWRKPTNSLTKFMGSGMLPSNAYVTLEHEYVLVFRKGETRRFPPGDDARYESAFFWEERNRWFSDLWELGGTTQTLADREDAADSGAGTGAGGTGGAGDADDATESEGATDVRDRSAAYPLELPLRLVRMYSAYGDTVLDPFWGTGTTTLAAMLAARDSVGYELDPDFVAAFDDRRSGLAERSDRHLSARLERHRDFLADRDRDPNYEAVHYDVPVVTKQERRIRFYAVDGVDRIDDTDSGEGGTRETTAPARRYRVDYTPFEG